MLLCSWLPLPRKRAVGSSILGTPSPQYIWQSAPRNLLCPLPLDFGVFLPKLHLCQWQAFGQGVGSLLSPLIDLTMKCHSRAIDTGQRNLRDKYYPRNEVGANCICLYNETLLNKTVNEKP